jgi:Domain of unknown function (DUF4167)
VAGNDDRREPMRQGQQNRRGRGRTNNAGSNTSNSNNNNNNNNNSNNGRKPQNPLSRNYESSGPDVKIRGTAAQIAEKYMTLARDAMSSGDIVTAENYLQHAEHYHRIILAAQVQAATQHPHGAEPAYVPNGHHRPQPDGLNSYGMRDQPQPVIEQPQPQQPSVIVPGSEPQPEIASEPDAAAVNGVHSETAEQAAPRGAVDADGRRRRRRYPAGGAAGARSAAAAGAPAATATEPAANGHNGNGNGVDSEGRPSDEALAN